MPTDRRPKYQPDARLSVTPLAVSAGVCPTCGKYVEKRYGGLGRFLPECGDCWTRGWAEEMAVARAIEEASGAD